MAEDAARRERNALLRSFESSTVTKSNFLVLKRMKEADLDAQLLLARKERDQFRAAEPRPERSGPREERAASPHQNPPSPQPHRGRPPR